MSNPAPPFSIDSDADMAPGRSGVDLLRREIEVLVLPRQSMRGACGSRSALEENRLALVDLQWQFPNALIAGHTHVMTQRHAA